MKTLFYAFAIYIAGVFTLPLLAWAWVLYFDRLDRNK